MFSNKNKTIDILKIKDDSKNILKVKFNLKKSFISENKKKKGIGNHIEKNNQSKNITDKIILNKNKISNNILNINNKHNNNINKNIENYSKIKNSNNSSDNLNKSILTTSNSEIKYRKNINSHNQKNNNDKSSTTQIGNKNNIIYFHKINNKNNRVKTEEKNESNSKDNKEFLEENLNFRQKEKLKKLKYLIFIYDRKNKTIGKNNKNNTIINLEKRKLINFCREKKITKFIPCNIYDKTNIFLNKKYFTKKYNENEEIKKNSTIFQINTETNQNNKDSKINNKISNETSRTVANENKTRIKLISKFNLNNLFTKNNYTFNMNNLYKRYNSSKNNHYDNLQKENDFLKIYKKRSKSSYKPNKYSIINISKSIKDDYSKAIFPMTQRLITESNIINDEISKEKNNDILHGYFGDESKKIPKLKKKPVDLKRIRKDINLYNIKSYFNETNLIYKGTKRIEKLLTSKKEVKLARKIAQRVINEDILLNNYFDFDATYNIRLQRLKERRLYTKFAGDTTLSKNNMKINKKQKTDREKLFKILKGGLENYFDKKSLQYLIFKYKAINLNNWLKKS